METKIILIALAIFSIVILLAQNNIEKIYALTIETVTFGSTVATTKFNNCQYISTTQVWCASDTGIKVWNPTARSVTTTIESGNSFDDVKCGGTYCYLWDVISTGTANLTKYQISGFVLNNETQFVGNAGFVVGHGIGLATVSGETASDVLLLPVEGQSCLGGADNKGMCVFDGATFEALRFITSSQTNDSNAVFDIEWNGETASISQPTANRAIVKFRDVGGNFFLYNINLADSDTTFALTQICVTASLGSAFTSQAKMSIIDGIVYHTQSTSDMVVMDSTLDTCATGTKTNFVDETNVIDVTYSTTDNIFIVSARTADGSGVESNGLYVFNATLSSINTVADRVLKVNLTANAPNHLNFHFNHQAEGEIHAWRGSDMLIISDLLTAEEPDPNTEFCSQPENFNLLRCVLERGDTTPLIGSSQLINQSGTNIICQIGLVECTQDEDGNFTPNDPNIQTNGIGYIFLVVAMGIMIGIFWVASRGDLGSIPTFVWFLATMSIIGVITAFGWIDPTVLIIAVIAIVALATAKAKGIFGSSGLFAGET